MTDDSTPAPGPAGEATTAQIPQVKEATAASGAVAEGPATAEVADPLAALPGHRQALHDFVVAPENLTLPDFSGIDSAALLEVLEFVESFQAARLAELVADPAAPTFINTTLRIDEATAPAFRLAAVARVIGSNIMTEAITDAVNTVFRRLAALQTGLLLDADLYARLDEVPTAALTPEDRRHHELMVADFVHAGAKLDPDARARVRDLSAEITRLETDFDVEVLAESDSLALQVPYDRAAAALAGLDAETLAGLREPAGASAGDAAEAGYTLPLVNTTQQPALEHLDDPATRAALLERSMSRGGRGGAHDTRTIIADLTALRAALAAELGYRSFADYSISTQAAGSPDAASALLSRMLEPAQAQAAAELDAVRSAYGLDELGPADVTHYLARYKQDHFALDPRELRSYFEFDRVLVDGAFYAATQLYGVEFVRTELSGWHPDVTVYAAVEDGAVTGLVCVDPYARPIKGGGAWMDQLVSPGRYLGQAPILTLSTNFAKPAEGAPLLLSVDNVRTVFHEFGHVLHGLFSDSLYSTRSGTSVPRDFVEFPSQFNEMWMFHPAVLPNYAVDHRTGRSLPQETVERLHTAERFGQGFSTVELLAAALLDLGWHSLQAGEQVDAVLSFEAAVLDSAGFDSLIPPRYRSTYFRHIFSGGYAAGYYAYLWSEVLAAYTQEWFTARGLSPEAGEAFRAHILAPGYSADPSEYVREFFGEDPGVGPLLRSRGLAPVEDADADADGAAVAGTGGGTGAGQAEDAAGMGNPGAGPDERDS